MELSILAKASIESDYFSKYKIRTETLLKYKVVEAKTVYKNGIPSMKSTAKNPIFVYRFPSKRVKIYRPLSPDPLKK